MSEWEGIVKDTLKEYGVDILSEAIDPANAQREIAYWLRKSHTEESLQNMLNLINIEIQKTQNITQIEQLMILRNIAIRKLNLIR